MNLLYLYIICRFIFCQQISVFLLFTKSSTLSDHFIFLLRFQFFIGKDQLVLTDIIIFYEIFLPNLVCPPEDSFPLHWHTRSVSQLLRSLWWPKLQKRHLLHWLQKNLCHNEIWIYFYFVIYVLFYIQKHRYSSFTERISNMKPLSSFKPQAVFSDIDGTLLTSEHVVSPLTSSAIHTLTDQGVLFTISSARSPSGIRPIIKKNDFHCCTIAFSGALILDEDQNILYEKGISISDASKIIDVIEKKCPHVTWNVFTSEDWIVKDRTDPHVIHEETVVETTSIEGSLQSLSDTLMVDKILCMCDSEYMSPSETLLRKYFPELSIARSSDSLLEIMAGGINKAEAVKYLCDLRKIPLTSTIAFGDNYNDLEMLEAVGCGVLMGNAPSELQKHFSFVTKSNDQDGIFQAFKELGVLN